MSYYILAFAIYSFFITLLMRRNATQSPARLFVLGLVPAFFLVLCRGDVGTDTAAYLRIIDDIQNNRPTDLELGFVLLVKTMLLIGMTPQFILAAIASISTALLIYAAQLSQRSLFLCALCIVPIFYFDITMNGLRYGLAFACTMCAVALFYQKRLYLCVIFATCAVLFHLSGGLLVLMMALLSDDKEEFRYWTYITIGLGVLIVTLQNVDQILYLFDLDVFGTGVDLNNKISAYSNFPSPSLLSGVGPLTLSLLTLVLIKKEDNATKNVRVRRFYFLLLATIGTFVVAKFSYAGLRLQFVVLFFMLLTLQFKPAFESVGNVKRSKKMLATMMLIGFLGMAAFMKNALTTESQGLSPWLPYSFNPELTTLFNFNSYANR